LFTSSTLDRLTTATIEEGLNNLGIALAKGDAKLLCQRYDADGDGKLSFWEFANIFLPLDDRLRQSLESRKVQNQAISSDIRHLIKRVLNRAINAEVMTEDIRLKI